jgi:hypothetical protein
MIKVKKMIQRNDGAPVDDNPGDVQRDRQAHKAGAQRHEESNLLGTSSNAHHRFLSEHSNRDAGEKKCTPVRERQTNWQSNQEKHDF